MTTRENYTPGPADVAQVQKADGDAWTLVLTRHLRHAPPRVWAALTDPAQLREWAPFEADGDLGTAGRTVRLSTVGAPQPHVSATTVVRADAPHLLIYDWGGREMKWQLDATEDGGTTLRLWTSIDRRYIAMGAAGWHVCLDVLDHLLGDSPIGRIAGGDAMQFDGWQRLHRDYAASFGVDAPSW